MILVHAFQSSIHVLLSEGRLIYFVNNKTVQFLCTVYLLIFNMISEFRIIMLHISLGAELPVL